MHNGLVNDYARRRIEGDYGKDVTRDVDNALHSPAAPGSGGVQHESTGEVIPEAPLPPAPCSRLLHPRCQCKSTVTFSQPRRGW